MKDKAALIFFLAVLCGALGVAARMVAPYLMALAMGALLALIARPLQRRLRAAVKRKTLAAALTTALVVLIVVAPLVLFTALAVRQGMGLAKSLAAGELSLDELLGRATAFLPDSLGLDAAELKGHMADAAKAAASYASGLVLATAKSVPDAILQLILASIACFFFLLDGHDFGLWIVRKLPLDANVRQALTASFKDTAISVVWASMAASLTQALVMSVAYLALGVPGSFLAGGATFICAWIPILGSTPVWIIGAGVLYAQGALAKAAAMVAFGLVAGVVDNFVRPLVLKGRGEMHPLVSLVAIFGGIQMFGLFGVFFGPILAAAVLTLLQVWPRFARRYGIEIGDGVTPAGPRTGGQ